MFCGQSHRRSMIVYNNLLTLTDEKSGKILVVNYDYKMFIRLVTGWRDENWMRKRD